jgi:Mor family transcriptional regulator
MPKSVSIKEMIDVIGEEAVQKLIDNFAGRTCYFKKDPIAIEFPDQESKELFAKNAFHNGTLSVPEIADYLKLSVDHVRKLINKK